MAAEVDAKSGAEIAACFEEAFANAFVVAEVSLLEAIDPRLNPRVGNSFQRIQPIAEWTSPVRADVLKDEKWRGVGHVALGRFVSYMMIIVLYWF